MPIPSPSLKEKEILEGRRKKKKGAIGKGD